MLNILNSVRWMLFAIMLHPRIALILILRLRVAPLARYPQPRKIARKVVSAEVGVYVTVEMLVIGPWKERDEAQE